MTIRASGHVAFMLGTAILVTFASPSLVEANTGAAKPESGGSETKSAHHHWHHHRHYAHRRFSRTAHKFSNEQKASADDVANEDSADTKALPRSVANANAQLAPAEPPAGDARAMTARASDALQLMASDQPDPSSAAATPIVAADQLNDVDRALHAASPSATSAMASADMPAPRPAAAVLSSSNDDSTWDKASLIGKIFIGFGGLLTFASAARMFMA